MTPPSNLVSADALRCPGIFIALLSVKLLSIASLFRDVQLMTKTAHRGKYTHSQSWRRTLAGAVLTIVVALTCSAPKLWAEAPASMVAQVASGPDAPHAEPAPSDSLGRDTPRGTLEGYIRAVSQEDYQKAAQYLDLSPLPFAKRIQGQQVARILQQTLDRNGNLPPTVMLSDDAKGDTDDDLAPDAEKIGSLHMGEETAPLLLRRDETGEQPVWLISSETLNQLPNRIEEASSLPINQLIPEVLLENKWHGVPWGHWIAMLLLAGISFLVCRAVVAVLIGAAQVVMGRTPRVYPAALIKAFAAPTRLFFAVLMFVTVAQRAGISIIVRQYLSEAVVIVGWISVLWLVWRLVDAIAAVSEKRMTSRARYGALSAVLLVRRSSRLLLISVGIIVALDTAGVNVTTGLAALGVGGLALAFGAKRMVEDLVGSMTLVFDQPVRIGDFCQVGEMLGTVEQIGMRSTRIRTLDRTLVTIPNGDFSAQQIENYSHRDRFLFNPTLALHYETSPEQIRQVLVELRAVLDSQQRIGPDPARVRFLGFGSNSLDIEVFAYVPARDYDDFLEAQEVLNLGIADVIANSGTGFAFPSQTVYLGSDASLSQSQRPQAASRAWRERGSPAPDFTQERVG